MAFSNVFDAVMGLFGFRRAVLGHWPHNRVIEAALAEIENAGGVVVGVYGAPAGELECKRFRVNGRRVRLCVEDYGDIVLWGPRRLVLDLSQKISRRLDSSQRDQSLEPN
jgi:hypothetical protein